jgi:hypothetical protein
MPKCKKQQPDAPRDASEGPQSASAGSEPSSETEDDCTSDGGSPYSG